jgi:hypothetical protein
MIKEEMTDILDHLMGTEPGFQLPADFARKVTNTIVRREQWKSDLQEYFYLLALLSGLVVALLGIYYLVDKALLIRTLNFLVTNWIPVAFLFLTLNFVLFFDKVILGSLFARLKAD